MDGQTFGRPPGRKAITLRESPVAMKKDDIFSA